MITKIFNKIQFLFYSLVITPFYNILYRNKGLINRGCLIRCRFKIKGQNNKIIIEENVVLKNTVFEINGNNNTMTISSGSRIYEKGRFRMEDDGGGIFIGNNLHASGIFLSKADNDTHIEIGNNCLFSANIIVRSSDAHSIIDVSDNVRINPGKNVCIGNHVWIGYGVTILKGSRIENDCIVGTNSVVAGLISTSNSLIVGMPAKVVKMNVNWNTERI